MPQKFLDWFSVVPSLLGVGRGRGGFQPGGSHDPPPFEIEHPPTPWQNAKWSPICHFGSGSFLSLLSPNHDSRPRCQTPCICLPPLLEMPPTCNSPPGGGTVTSPKSIENSRHQRRQRKFFFWLHWNCCSFSATIVCGAILDPRGGTVTKLGGRFQGGGGGRGTSYTSASAYS